MSDPKDTPPAPASPGSASTELAPQAQPATPAHPRAAMLPRLLVGLAGLGLFVGFFLPWVHLGGMVSLSGLTMMLSGGEFMHELSGPHRVILFVVPLSGLLLFAGAVRGYRGIVWGGLAASVTIILVGLYTLIRVFLDSTGAGMWLVVLSTLLAMAVSIVAYRLR